MPFTSGTVTATLGGEVGGVRLNAQNTTATMMTTMVAMPAQIHATGGRDCVRALRSLSIESWRSVASEPERRARVGAEQRRVERVVRLPACAAAPGRRAATSTSCRNSLAVW